AMVPGLTRLTSAVHRHRGKVFAQLAHAGSQSRVSENRPLAPSPVPNALTGRMVQAATAAEIAEVIEAFAAGARRAVRAGFDGVHVHAANGYLISEFSSPPTNRREDEWGRSAQALDRLLPAARELRQRTRVPIILVGGMRLPTTMETILERGEADFVAMARPFIREPDLVVKLAQGRRGPVECTSCNLCLMHESHHSLRCWRVPRRRLLEHAIFRLRGGLREAHRPHSPR